MHRSPRTRALPRRNRGFAAALAAQIPGRMLDFDAGRGLYQAAAGTGLCVAAGDPVGHWVDGSGRHHPATQSVAGQRPTLQFVSGRPVVRFVGASSQAFDLGTNVSDLAINGDLSIFAVARKTGATAFMAILSYQQNAGTVNSYEFRFTNDATPHLDLVHANGATSDEMESLPTTFSDNSFHVLSVVRSGLNVSFYKNGGAAVTDTATVTPTSSASSRGWIGSRNQAPIYLTGDLSALLLFNRALTASERTQVRDALNARWGVY